MEIKDEKKVWNDCRERVSDMIRLLTKETESEQQIKYMSDAYYRSTIDLFTQMLFTIETDERFIREQEKVKVEALYLNMKSTLKMYDIDID